MFALTQGFGLTEPTVGGERFDKKNSMDWDCVCGLV